MEKQIKYLILLLLVMKQSIGTKCINNYCDCNELKNEVKCTNNSKIKILKYYYYFSINLIGKIFAKIKYDLLFYLCDFFFKQIFAFFCLLYLEK